jgi:AcrR family transcriptional regulator
MEKRTYRSPLREEQARLTRDRILDAALTLFATQGYGATSIAAIAREAGVVPETIYASLGSKRGIIDGLIERVAPPQVVGGILAGWAANAGDPAAQLGVLARFATEFWAKSDTLASVLRQGTGDADIAGEWRSRQADRRGLFARLIADWPDGTIRAGVSIDAAVDIAWVLTSDDVYTLFVRERKWSTDRYVTWLHDTLVRDLLAT